MFAELALATIISTTQASAETGGNTVSSGGTVYSGSEDVSVEVAQTVNSSSGSTTVTTEVTKTENGSTTKTSETKTYSEGEPVITEVKVEASSGGMKSSKPAVQTDPEPPTLQASADAEASAEAAHESPATAFEFVAKISTFISKLFSWFGF